jgi:hypothetical protein
MLINNKFITILDISSIGLGNEGMLEVCEAFVHEDNPCTV